MLQWQLGTTAGKMGGIEVEFSTTADRPRD
jgi:hypothetical protein